MTRTGGSFHFGAASAGKSFTLQLLIKCLAAFAS
jgi:hypothetical protein